MSYQELGKKLRAAREKQEISLRELHDDSGVHRNVIHKLEMGVAERTSFETVALLAHALKLDINELGKSFKKKK